LGFNQRIRLPTASSDGYTATNTSAPADKGADAAGPEPLGLAISGLLPRKDVPMQAWAAPFPSGGKAGASIPIALGLRLDLPAREERINEIVDLRVDAYTPDGKLRTSHTLRTNVVLKPGPAGPGLYEVLTSVSLPAGRYQLRMAASLSRLRRSGSVYFDVDVPDVSKGALTWSGLAVHVSPSVQTAVSSALQTGIPIAPTSKRLYSRTDAVTTFARIHQGGKSAPVPVLVIASVTDAAGREVWKQSETLMGDRFTTVRGADVRVAVPVAQLESGFYRFRLEATQGKASAVRDSRFTVR
jgi:hypothetical protein